MHNKFSDLKTQNEDRRNLVIFMIAVFLLFALYDIFIKQPYVDQLRDEQAQEMSQQPEIGIAAEAEEPAPKTKAQILAQSPRITIDTPTLTGSIALKGARIDDLILDDFYLTPDSQEKVVLLNPAGTDHAHYSQFGWVSSDQNLKIPDNRTIWKVAGANRKLTPSSPVTLYWDNGQGVRFEQIFSIDDQYMFNIDQNVINNSGDEIYIHSFGLVTQHGELRNSRKAYILHEGPIGYINKELQEYKFKKLKKEGSVEKISSTGWIGITQKYWFTGLIPEQHKESKYRFLAQPGSDMTLYQTDILGPRMVIGAGQQQSFSTHYFAGPKKVRMLDAYEKSLKIPHFDLVVDFGMFYFLTKPFFYALTWLSHSVGSFAIGLILFTVCLRILVFPLANKSYRSFARMRKIAPQMKELQERHKNNREEMQKALFDLYKKENVNPAAGCLPMLVQIPIFFALYKVLYVTLEMRHAPFFGWIQDMSVPDPTSLFNLFGLLAWDPPSFLMIGAWPCIMFITLTLQQRLSPPPTDGMQKQIMMMMPFVMTFILSKFPAGLVIYWTWSNTLSIIQQSILMKSMGVKIHLFSFLYNNNNDEEEDDSNSEENTEKSEQAKAKEKPKKAEKKPITPPKRKRKKK